MSQTIIKRTHTREFVIIPNAIAEDEKLSLEAKGLLLYLLAKPDNWVVQTTDIQRRCGVGRNKAYQLIRDLCKAGYAKRTQQRIGNRFGQQVIEIFDFPVKPELPLFEQQQSLVPDFGDAEIGDAENEDAEIQHAENGDLNKNPSLPSTHSLKKPTPTKTREGGDLFDEKTRAASGEFDAMWAEWVQAGVTMPENSQAAFNRYLSLPENLRKIAREHGNDYRLMQRALQKKPMLMRWLSREWLIDFENAPPINSNGEWQLSSYHPEYSEWLDYHCRGLTSSSEYMVSYMATGRDISVKDRKPPAFDEEKWPIKWRAIAPWSKDWVQYRFNVLFAGTQRDRPKAPQYLEQKIADGDVEELRKQRTKHCWPTVLKMDDNAQAGRGFALDVNWHPREDLHFTEQLPIDAPLVKAMNDWARERLWPGMIVPPDGLTAAVLVPGQEDAGDEQQAA